VRLASASAFIFYVQLFKTPLFPTFITFFKVQVYFSTLAAKNFQQKLIKPLFY